MGKMLGSWLLVRDGDGEDGLMGTVRWVSMGIAEHGWWRFRRPLYGLPGESALLYLSLYHQPPSPPYSKAPNASGRRRNPAPLSHALLGAAATPYASTDPIDAKSANTRLCHLFIDLSSLVSHLNHSPKSTSPLITQSDRSTSYHQLSSLRRLVSRTMGAVSDPSYDSAAVP